MGVPLSVARGRRRPGDRWTERDWLLAQAWSDVERNVCPDCHTPLDKALDPELERKWKVDQPLRCHPCTVRAQAARSYYEYEHDHPDYIASALRFPVTLTE